MSIAMLIGYIIVALLALGLIGFARIKGLVSKTVDLTEKVFDAANESADLVKEVNSRIIAELKAGIKTSTPKVTKKVTKKKSAPKKTGGNP